MSKMKRKQSPTGDLDIDDFHETHALDAWIDECWVVVEDRGLENAREYHDDIGSGAAFTSLAKARTYADLIRGGNVCRRILHVVATEYVPSTWEEERGEEWKHTLKAKP